MRHLAPEGLPICSHADDVEVRPEFRIIERAFVARFVDAVADHSDLGVPGKPPAKQLLELVSGVLFIKVVKISMFLFFLSFPMLTLLVLSPFYDSNVWCGKIK